MTKWTLPGPWKVRELKASALLASWHIHLQMHYVLERKRNHYSFYCLFCLCPDKEMADWDEHSGFSRQARG